MSHSSSSSTSSSISDININLNRKLIRGDRLRKEFQRQDQQSQGLSALTRALMTVPSNKQAASTFGGSRFLAIKDRTDLLASNRHQQDQQKQKFAADYSQETLSIIERAKVEAEVIQEKLERTLIAQERRAKAQLEKTQKKNLHAFLNSQRPVLDLVDEQKRRVKINGDPGKEVEEMRRKEAEQKREERKRREEEEEEAEEE